MKAVRVSRICKAEVCRPRATICLVAAALLLNSALTHAAGDVPDIKGPWTGKTFTIVAGAAPHWPNNTGTFANPSLGEKDLVINVTNQEGRRFWGTATLSGNGDKSDEPFIGELYGPENRKVTIAHTVGIIEGEIDGDVSRFASRRRTRAARPRAAW